MTADLCARAIIAAARSYGDDPVAACEATKMGRRKALTAAAGAVARVTGRPTAQMERLFGVGRNCVSAARRTGSPGFRAAETAAERAARYAAWRPGAAESVAGGADADDVETSERNPPPSAAPTPPPAGEEPSVEVAYEPDLTPVAAGPGPARALTPAAARHLADDRRAADPARGGGIPIRTDAAGLTAKPGRIAVDLRPTFAPPAALPGGERPIRDLVLEALADGPRDSMNIASMIDRKELAVVSTLTALRSEGRVADEPFKGGPRAFRWRLTREAAA